jgi:RNA polymerase sigma factor (sigma-70 family)
MPTAPWDGVIDYLRRVVAPCDVEEATDGQLMDSFVVHRDQGAFEAILRRHGPMVLGVCRRVLHHVQDAEDAFQATFLVLVRRANSVSPRDRVGNWLYGVAYRTALEAKRAAARRRAKEREAPPKEAIDEISHREWQLFWDQELSRLPDKYRLPIVLCDLEGRTQKEAARHMGWREGTLSGRLSRARGLLAKRLSRHGLLFSSGLASVALSPDVALAQVPSVLLISTLKAARAVAANSRAAVAVSDPVAALYEGVSRAMFVTKLKIVALVILTVAFFGWGMGALAYRLTAAESDAVSQQTANQPGLADDETAPLKKPTSSPAADVKALAENPTAADAKPAIKFELPTTPPPVQILVVASKKGHVTITMEFKVPRRVNEARIDLVSTTEKKEFKVEDIQVYDTKGERIAGADLDKRLDNEVLALGSTNGKKVDPLHLRLVKEGTLIFVFPPFKPKTRARAY